MADTFIIQKSCGECANIGTSFCRRPDECVSRGYKDFVDPHTLTEKFCPVCGERWRRPFSKKYSPEYRVVSLVCPGCGNKKFLHIEVKNKT